MRSFLALFLVVAFASVSLAIVCLPNQCDHVKCAALDETECLTRGSQPDRYRFMPRGGFCGCCPSCVRVLEENENCFGLLLHGMPPRVVCADGLHCDPEKVVCTKTL